MAFPDPLVDSAGFDPRSAYVERFWLPVLGPTATWLLRRIADRLTTDPDGFELSLEDTARALGLGGVGGRYSPFNRAFDRCLNYRALRHASPGVLAVRRRLGPVPAHLVRRFPAALADEHRRWPTRADGSTAPDNLPVTAAVGTDERVAESAPEAATSEKVATSRTRE